MDIHIKESQFIRPAQQTPKICLPTCDLDLLVLPILMPTVYFYPRRPSPDSFFEPRLLKQALTKALVPFHPMAGRLGTDANGRIEIHCNGEGVLFLEAESTNRVIHDFDDNTPSAELLRFVPSVDYSKGLSSYPLVAIQVTRFTCGGICLGIGVSHVLVDATAKYHFINSWAELTRGLPAITVPPFYNRLVMESGIPNSPRFHHIEYDPPPSINDNPDRPSVSVSVSSAVLKLSPAQINTLKAAAGAGVYSTFEVTAAHVWRCVCKARGLPYDQLSKLHIPTNGRSKLNPPLPDGFLGNVVFSTTPMALTGDIQSEPLNYTVELIHKALKRMDNEYMKSALAYLKQRRPDLTALRRGAHTFKSPNFNISKLVDIPVYDANFGWGAPSFAKPVFSSFDGMSYVLPNPEKDGSLSLVIYLDTTHMELFKKFFYDIVFNSRM